jgi:hypothetical protein
MKQSYALLWYLAVVYIPLCQGQAVLFNNISSPTVIRATDIPITISTPGRYILVEDASYNASTNVPAISITTSSVTVDLLNFSLAQSSLLQGITGIQVLANNSAIKNFSYAAVSFRESCSQILVENLSVSGCGQRGVELVGLGTQPIRAATVRNCTFINSCTISSISDNVLTLSNVTDSTVDNCLITTCGSALITGTCTMLKMTAAQRCQILNMDINNNVGQFDLRGISINEGIGNIITNCIVNGMVATGGGSRCRGFFLESNVSATANYFFECAARSLTGTSIVDGFLSDTGCNDNVFENCRAENLLSRDVASICHGFRVINNNRCRFLNCYALTCSSLSTVASPLFGTYGFRMDTSTGTILNNCLADSNTAANAGRGVGYFIFATSQCCIANCQANRNTIGFDASNLTAGAAGTYNQQSFIQNMAQKNLAAQYNTNTNAWPAASNDTVANNAMNGLTDPWQNVGVT